MFVFVEQSVETLGSDGSGFRILFLCNVRIDVLPCKAFGSDGSGFRILLLGNTRIEVSPRKTSGSDGSRIRILFPYSDAGRSEPEVLSAMVQKGAIGCHIIKNGGFIHISKTVFWEAPN